MSSVHEWLVDRVVPEIVSRQGGTLLGVEVGDKKGGNPTDGGFVSATFKIQLTILKNRQEEKHFLIAKTPFELAAVREFQRCDLHFMNEKMWYTEMVPAVEVLGEGAGAVLARQLWPRCYLSLIESEELATVVMNDLSQDGYILARTPAADLDFDHAALAFERLAQQHAISYTLKQQNPEFYNKYIQNLQEIWYLPEKKDEMDLFFTSTTQRGISPLRSRAECADLVSALDQALGDSPFNLQAKLVRPRDKNTSVLCHGDFTRNNVLYKYNVDGSLADARLIDFATIREASPAIDLCFLLYVSVSPCVLEGPGLRNLLTRYHSALLATLKELSGPEDPWNGDVTAIETELGQHVLYIYCTCSFFLGIMMSEDKSDFKIEDSFKMTPEEQVEINLKIGGEEVTLRLMNMLLDWQKRGFHHLWN